MARHIQIRRDTAANWTSANPTLAQNELGYETDTKKVKNGDGSTAWNTLAYGVSSDTLSNLVAGQFTDVAEKTSTVGADKFLIEDSADSNAKKYIQATNLPAGVDTTAVHKATAGEIAAMTIKASPIGADYIMIEDSADSNNKKYVLISGLPTGSDTDAIHDNVANEITAIAPKTVPVSADVILIEDSEDSFNKKKLAVTNFPGGVDTTAIHKATAAEISAMTAKTTPVRADLVVIEDSANSNNKKKVAFGDMISGIVGLFSMTKNGDQATLSTTFVTVTSWDTPNINSAGITVNSGAGTFTFDEDGTYEVGYCLTDDSNITSTRNKAHHQLVLDDTLIKGTLQQTYNRQVSDGATNVSCSVIIVVTAGQVMKLEFRTDNGSISQQIIADSCVLNIKRWA